MTMHENRSTSTFSKRLRANGHYFAFDSNVNRLMPLDKVSYQLLPYFNSPGHAQEKYKNRFKKSELKDKLSGLQMAYMKGFFRSRHQVKTDFSKNAFIKNTGKKLDKFTLSLTEQCNQRCKYCIFSEKNQGYRSHSAREMDIDMARKAIDFILTTRADEIQIAFYGGEPLLKFDLIKGIVEYAHRKNTGTKSIEFIMTTNGTLLSKKIVDFLVSSNIILSVSLDGPLDIHDRNRVFSGKKGTFKPVIKNLEFIKANYPDYYRSMKFVSVIAPPYDYHRLDDFFSKNNSLFDENNLVLTDLKREGNGFFDDPEQKYFSKEQSEEKLRGYRAWIIRRMQDPGFSPDIFQKSFIRNLFGAYARVLGDTNIEPVPRYCKPGFSTLYIASGGTFHICENLPSSLPIGDLENGISPDLCFDAFNRYMEVVGKDCLDCWAYSFCPYCIMYFYDFAGDGFIEKQKAREKCRGIKKEVKKNFETFLGIIAKNPAALEWFN